MKLRYVLFFGMFPLLAAACGTQVQNQVPSMDFEGGPGVASPADANGAVTFTFVSMQDLNVVGRQQSYGEVDITNPNQIESARGKGLVNIKSPDLHNFDRIVFTLSAPGLPNVTIAKGEGDLNKEQPVATLDVDESQDFAAYLRSPKFSFEATVTYKTPVQEPKLDLNQVLMSVQVRH